MFHRDERIVANAQRELTQHDPQPGWVQHDAGQIWTDQLAVAQDALKASGLAATAIAALGATNQRETTMVWERARGRPLHPSIVWQNRRTEPLCAQLHTLGGAPGRVPTPAR